MSKIFLKLEVCNQKFKLLQFKMCLFTKQKRPDAIFITTFEPILTLAVQLVQLSMKNIFFLLAIIFSFQSKAQQTLDTVFHPVYGTTQLLEVKQKQWYPETKAFISTAKNAEELKNLPIYVFRNNLGEVTKTYNDFNNLDKRLFIRDYLHKEEPIAHKIKAKNTSILR
jgi:hypothetical protein